MQPPHTQAGLCTHLAPLQRQPLWLTVLFGVCTVEVQEELGTHLLLPGEAVPRGGTSSPEATALAWQVCAGAIW